MDPDLYQAILSELEQSKVVRQETGNRLALPAHKPTLAGKDAEAVGPLEAKFRDGGFSPPSAEEALAACKLSGKEGQAALTLLIQKGILLRAAEGLLFHRDPVNRAREMLVAAAEAPGQVESGKFRDQPKPSRTYAIALLDSSTRRAHQARRKPALLAQVLW